MDDLISRQAAIDMFQNLAYDDWNQGVSTTWANAFSECAEMTRDLPSAEPERKKGWWIDLDSDTDRYDDIKCSCCKHHFTVDAYDWTDIGFVKDDLKFCPNCGAKMEQEDRK